MAIDDKSAALYLIPCTVGDTPIEQVLPSYNKEVILSLKYFIVEEIRTARRFLKQVDKSIDIDALTFYSMGKHCLQKNQKELSSKKGFASDVFSTYLDPLRRGESIGVISEAGCPAVADPGADIVAIAQKEHLKVVPLVGPSSIILTVMGSGFNGQSFAFHGYLPIDGADRQRRLKDLESQSMKYNQTQLFIETPFRNKKIFEDICKSCRLETKLCVAAGITTKQEYICTKTIKQWKKDGLPDLAKIPAVFAIYAR